MEMSIGGSDKLHYSYASLLTSSTRKIVKYAFETEGIQPTKYQNSCYQKEGVERLY